MNVTFEGKTETGKDEWLTPPDLLANFKIFSLDPCSPINRPWPTAKIHFTKNDNGLLKDWGGGLVYCNPPYGKEAAKWLKKSAEHNNTIVLIFARVETKAFFTYVWEKADSVFFIKGRLKFYNVDGTKAQNSAGAPSVLIAYGKEASEQLENLKIKGKFIKLNNAI